jgi:hypothetical protein
MLCVSADPVAKSMKHQARSHVQYIWDLVRPSRSCLRGELERESSSSIMWKLYRIRLEPEAPGTDHPCTAAAGA